MQGRDRDGGGKKGSGISHILLAKADLYLSSAAQLFLPHPQQLPGCSGKLCWNSLLKSETKIQPCLTHCDGPASRGNPRGNRGNREAKVKPNSKAHEGRDVVHS